MYLAPTMDPMDFQDNPGKLEMGKTEMTKKNSRIGLITSMDSYIKSTSSTFTPCQPSIPFPFLSPVFQLSPRQQILVWRKPARPTLT
jgi:hypothetical protein